MDMKWAVLFLGCSIMVSSFIVAGALNNQSYPQTQTSNISQAIYELAYVIDQHKNGEGENEYSHILYQTAAAEYLGMTYSELNKLLKQEEFDIPYIKVGDRYIFYKGAIDEWLKSKRGSYEVSEE